MCPTAVLRRDLRYLEFLTALFAVLGHRQGHNSIDHRLAQVYQVYQVKSLSSPKPELYELYKLDEPSTSWHSVPALSWLLLFPISVSDPK